MYVDLTLPLNEQTLLIPKPGSDSNYPGGSFEANQIENYDEHGGRVYQFSQNTHTGTHMDSPAHYAEHGDTIDQIDLDLLTGPAKIVDLREHRGTLITAEILDAEADNVGADDRVVFLTGDVDAHFHKPEDPRLADLFEAGSAFSVDAADWLAERDVGLIANDFITESTDLSKDLEYNPDRPVHRRICGAGIPVVEYICNVDPIVERGIVEFVCTPLPLTGLEASPTRVLAEV
jgi:kynurenine formamidase